MTWFLGILGVLVAAWAAWIGLEALRISERMEANAQRERNRADARDRLMWMQTLLNELRPLQEAMAAPHETDYVNRQRWMRTALAVAGLRNRLPQTTALSERPFSSGWVGMVDAVDRAWHEIHDALEQDADRVYFGERLGH